jgi:hypothetical protein
VFREKLLACFALLLSIESNTQMSQSKGSPSEQNPISPQRWYDKDPALTKALESLRVAPNAFHAQVALNIISVIVEHRLEELQQHSSLSSEAFRQSLMEKAQDLVMPSYGKRWYDVNETLQSAIQMLKDTPDDIQKHVIPAIALVIEQAIARDLSEA